MNVQCLRERFESEKKIKQFVFLRSPLKYKDLNVLLCVITKTQMLRHALKR